MSLLELIVKTDDSVIDVGGNRGIYTYILWKLGAKVAVFEPNPICSRILCEWSANKPTVNIHSVALSNRTGNANLHIPIDGSGVEHDASASIENTVLEGTREQLVPLRTLDSYGFESVVLIKADVEGHECAMIEGAAATIAGSRPALLIEIEQRHHACPIDVVFDQIRGLDYCGFFMEGNRIQPLEEFDASFHQSMTNFGERNGRYVNNFLFLNRDRLSAGEYPFVVGGQQ